ncbi:MAG: hypothetical protein HFH68_03455 [Lachnospiraceae bacterium]|nr:hypothetical protein [Lachnospiraceae bacterium]
MDKKFLAFSQVLQYNPVIKEDKETREWYLKLLEKHIRKYRWKTGEIAKQQQNLYKNLLKEGMEPDKQNKLNNALKIPVGEYSFVFLFDLFIILGFEEKELNEKNLSNIINEYYKTFGQIRRDLRIRHIQDSFKYKKLYQSGWQKNRKYFWQKSHKNLWWTSSDIILNCLSAWKNDKKAWAWIKERCKVHDIKIYLEKVEKNLDFIQTSPLSILVTSPMSAGKSTFLNAVTGENICKSQNMACTSRIHAIISKSFQDRLIYKWDKNLSMLINTEKLISSDESCNGRQLATGIYFDSNLSGKRLVFYDTPGVNYSGDKRHKEITDNFIESGKYGFVIFIMNATQLDTIDEQKHLEKIKKCIHKKQIIFVINKIDELNPDEEDFIEIIKRQEQRLVKMGFKNPLICPASAYSAILVNKWRNGKINNLEKMELYNKINKFSEMDLPGYYNRKFKDIYISDNDKKEEQLLKTCGIAYIEELLLKMPEEI